MLNITLGIAILLTTGLLFAKLVQLLRLPSVTGYILAGLVLGPSGLEILTVESVGHQLDHFTQIALMLLAFGIGEHIELRRLQAIARNVTYISLLQAIATYLFVLAATYIVAQTVSPESSRLDNFILAMLLGAVEQGLGGCMIGSLDKEGLRSALAIPDDLEVLLVLALGRPVETVVLEDTPSPDEVPYWRDKERTHHVPKRLLEEILVDF